MTKNIENIENPITIETKGFRDLVLQELRVRRENQQLRKDNQLLSDELTYFKERCADLEEEVNHLQKFADQFCSDEDAEAGRQFARELLDNSTAIAEEEAIRKAEAHYELCARVTYGDDF